MTRPNDELVVPFLDLGAQTAEVESEVRRGWSDILESSRFVGGEHVLQFEEEWAAYCGTTAAVGVANGTDALVLALRALGIGPGDEVVVPSNTFVATAEAVVLAGAVPRFADVDPDTLLMTAQSLKDAIGPETKAAIVVHLFGQMADMDELMTTASESGIDVIEDAAQAQGARWRGSPAGSLGRIGAFSFYPGKNLGAFGDAGALVTSDEEIAGRLRSLRDHGRGDGGHYDHVAVGTNSRLDALQAVVLSAKLRRLDGWNAARRALIARYRDQLSATAARLVTEPDESYAVYHLAVAQVDHRDTVRADLAAAGIATGIHYPTPCHRSSPYEHYADQPLPVVEAAAGRIVSLPIFPHMTNRQVDSVCSRLREVLRGR
jgi:dTDP-4-amino-4,6-dideoxygalactose transaminase